MLPTLLRRPWLLSCLIGALLAAVLLPISAVVFFQPPSSPSELAIALAYKAAAVVLLVLVARFAIAAVARLRSGDVLAKRWLLASSITLAVNGALLLLIWPGFWLANEYGLLYWIARNGFPVTQSPYTSIEYGAVLNIIPSGVGVVIVQVLFVSAVTGYLVAATAARLSRPRLAYLLLIPFLFLPTLLENLYPMRITPYTYVEILIVFRILVLAGRPRGERGRPAEFLLLIAGIALLAFWRSEGVLWIVAALAVGVLLWRSSVRKIAAVLAAVAIVAGMYGFSTVKADPAYQVISTTLNPLSVMLQKPLRGPHLERDLAALDTVFDLDLVRSMPDADGIPSSYTGKLLRKDAAEHLGEFNRAFLDIVLHNPEAFARARLTTFSDTHFATGGVPWVMGAIAYDERRPMLDNVRDFERDNVLATPLNRHLRSKAVQTILMVDDSWRPLPASALIWNAVPVLIAALVAAIVAAVRRRWIWSILFLGAVLPSAIVILTAPANFFMYYFTPYLVAWFLLTLAAVRTLERRLARRTTAADAKVDGADVPAALPA